MICSIEQSDIGHLQATLSVWLLNIVEICSHTDLQHRMLGLLRSVCTIRHMSLLGISLHHEQH